MKNTKAFSLHHVRLYKPKPTAIYCMCLQPNKKLGFKLALSRSDASIEIWNINQSPYIERTISSTVENSTIEGLGWFEDRLFSVGLHGLLVEYSLLKLCIVNKSTVTGEAAFCLDIDEKNKQIAVGTEHGYLNIFNITEDNIVFDKFLDKQEGRILCLKYDSTGSFIVSAGLDAIRIWNVSSGHAVHKMTTGRSEANTPTIVWCLAVTQDFTIISGDSRGKLTFWDGKIGAQTESYQSHRNDILSLCLSEDQTNLYCSGVDPNIVNFVKIQMKNGKEKWVRSIHKKIHDHDVRALILNNGNLYSGGTDAYLAFSHNQPKTLVQYPPILQNPCVTICKEARLIMMRYPKYIEIWNLGEIDEIVQSGNVIPLKKEPKKLMVLQRVVKNYSGDHKKEGIIFADMSNNGKWIAYGTRLGLRVFQFIYKSDETPQLLRVEIIDDTNETHLKGCFTPDSTQLITTLSDRSIRIYDFSDASLSVSTRLYCEEITDTITFLSISENGRYLVAADPASNIVVWKKSHDGWHFQCKLPKYSSPPTAIALHPTTSHLLITYADNKIVEYSIEEKRFSEFSKSLQKSLPENWCTRFYPIRNIFYNIQTNQILFHDENSMMSINQDKSERKLEGTKKKKQKIENVEEQVHQIKVVKKYKHLVHMDMLSDNEIVAVEVNPFTLLDQLPPVSSYNKFGTK